MNKMGKLCHIYMILQYKIEHWKGKAFFDHIAYPMAKAQWFLNKTDKTLRVILLNEDITLSGKQRVNVF